MNKTKKSFYLSNESLQKLELLKKINSIDYSKIIDILIKNQKKVQLF